MEEVTILIVIWVVGIAVYVASKDGANAWQGLWWERLMKVLGGGALYAIIGVFIAAAVALPVAIVINIFN